MLTALVPEKSLFLQHRATRPVRVQRAHDVLVRYRQHHSKFRSLIFLIELSCCGTVSIPYFMVFKLDKRNRPVAVAGLGEEISTTVPGPPLALRVLLILAQNTRNYFGPP